MKCYKCDEKLSHGELAVSAEPIFDSSTRWHINCFSCCVCSNILIDLLYYTKDKKLYCEKHFFQLKPTLVCSACDMVSFNLKLLKCFQRKLIIIIKINYIIKMI